MENQMGRSTHPTLVSPNAPFRSIFTLQDLDDALAELKRKALYRVDQKGNYNLASDFETVGTLRQELNEFETAIHAKLTPEVKCEELLDVAFSAILGVLFHKAKGENGASHH